MRDRIYGIPLTDVGARVNAITDKAMDDLWHALDAEFECPNDAADHIWKATREAARRAVMHEFTDTALHADEMSGRTAACVACGAEVEAGQASCAECFQWATDSVRVPA